MSSRSLPLAPPAVASGPSPSRIALVVAVAHGVNDAYAAFLHPLLPRIMDRLGLSITLAATLITAFSLASSLLQPVAGWLADRFGRRVFVVAGPVISGVFLSLVGWAPSFWVLVWLLILGGVGSALFHPPGASFAARVGAGRGSGLRFSVFSFGGAAGFALGPLVAVALVGGLGLRGLAVAMVPALVLAPALWLALPSGRSERTHRPPPGPRTVLKLLRGPLGLIFGISAVGAFVQRVYLTMMPIVAAAEGRSEAVGAVALSVFLAGQAAGTLAGGFLTDRMDRARLLAILSALALPAYVAALALPTGTAGGLAAGTAAGFLTMGMLPPLVILAQELVPEGVAVGSAVAMGLAWATGSLLLPFTGAVADLLGARPGALLSVLALALATAFALHPSLRRHAALGG